MRKTLMIVSILILFLLLGTSFPSLFQNFGFPSSASSLPHMPTASAQSAITSSTTTCTGSSGVLLSDDFAKDSSLNTSCWTYPTSTMNTMASDTSSPGSSFVIPQLSFSSSGMDMQGGVCCYTFTGIQSVNSYSLPLYLTAQVTMDQSYGGTFELTLVNSQVTNFVRVIGNAEPQAGFYGIWAIDTSLGFDNYAGRAVLDGSPQTGVPYVIDISVDASGYATVTLSTTGGSVIGTQSSLFVGTGTSYYVVLAQGEGLPPVTGPNEAIWSYVTLNSSSSSTSSSTSSFSSLSLQITESPNVTIVSVPFTTSFIAYASGGVSPYTISWTICQVGGTCSSEQTNPLSYTFSSQGDYSISAKVTDHTGSSIESNTITVMAGNSYQANFKFQEGDTAGFLGGNAPSVEFENNQGLLSSVSSGVTLATNAKVNWGGLVLPGWLLSFLGYSYPWYTISVSGESGTKWNAVTDLAVPTVQLSLGSYTTVYYDLTGFEIYPGVEGLLSQNLNFTASPTTPLALAEDLLSAVFTAAGVLPDMPSDLVSDVASYVAQNYYSALLQLPSEILSSTFFQLLWDLLSQILGNLESYLGNLALSVTGALLIHALTETVDKIGGVIAALGPFVYDLIALLDVLIKGNLWDMYQISQISPMFLVVLDSNQTINAILSTPEGQVGYENGTWENSANMSGFFHTEIVNSTYGFAIPITSQSYDMNLTLSCETASSDTYRATVYYGNQSNTFAGILQPLHNRTYALGISHGKLTTGSSNGPNYLFYLEIAGVLSAVLVCGVFAFIYWHKRPSKGGVSVINPATNKYTKFIRIGDCFNEKGTEIRDIMSCDRSS